MNAFSYVKDFKYPWQALSCFGETTFRLKAEL
jgi:hypothetical protein